MSPRTRILRIIRVAATLVAMALIACADAPTEGQLGHTFRWVDEDGVPTGINSAVPKYGGELFAYEKVLGIRPDTGNEETFLFEPSGFTMDDGGYYIADTMNHRIAVFDLEGDFVRSIGRQGEGPGELQFPGSIGLPAFFVRAGVLWVHVVPRGVTARFAIDGTLVEEIATAELSPRGIAVGKTAAGGIVLWELVNRRDGGYMLSHERIRVFGANGEVAAMVASPPAPTAAFVKVPNEEMPARRILSLASRSQAHFLRNEQILLSSGNEPMLRWYDLAGNLVRQVRLDVSTEVTPEDRAAVEATLDRAIVGADAVGDEEQAERWRGWMQRLVFAERRAPWRFTRIDDVGRVWAFKPFSSLAVSAEGMHAYEVRVFSPEGEYLGDTTLPPMNTNGMLGGVVQGRLLTYVDDPDTGEIIPTVFRIRSAVEGFEYER